MINCKLSDKAQWGDFREGFCGANKKGIFMEKLICLELQNFSYVLKKVVSIC